MDATVEAALAAKLLKLFPTTDSKFLAIPLGGAAFSREDLDFLDDDGGLSAEQLREKMAARNQFARILNDIPADSVVYTSENRLLWNEYRDVLENAQSARSVLSEAETRALDEARDYLTDEKAEGGEVTRVYSAALQKHYECKEAYQDLERIYCDERITSELAESPEEKAAWRERREPELAALKDKALQDWMILGNKEAVETHQATVARLNGKAPASQILASMQELDACRDEDLLTNDPVGTYSTFYSPSDIFDPEATWPSIHISKAEIRTLLDGAPDDIKRWAGAGAGALESLTVEYAEVVVMRPWFQPSFFESSSWRLPGGAALVSDGRVPRHGRIPTFITSMIVARRITKEWLASVENGGGASAGETKTNAGSGFLEPAVLTVRRSRRVVAAQADSATRPEPRVVVLHTGAGGRPMRPSRPRPRDQQVERRRPSDGNNGDRRIIVRVKSRGTTTRRRDVAAPPRPPSTPPPPPRMQRMAEDVELDGVTVLAYACRRIPESPRPNESLEWS